VRIDPLSGLAQTITFTARALSATALRDLKGQMQQLAKLEDMAAGKAPAKTGVEQRTPSDEERRLIKQVEAAKKKGGFTVTDPETQLRSAMQGVKTRLKNQISDLEHQIATKTRIVRESADIKPDAEMEALTARRDALREDFNAIFGNKGLTDEQRINNAIASAKRSQEEYRSRIKAGEFSPKKRTALTPTSPALKQARAERDAVKQEWQLLKDLSTQPLSKADKRNAAFRKRTETRIANLNRKILENDISAKAKQGVEPFAANVILKAEAARLQGILDDMRKATKPHKTADEISNQSYRTRTANRIAELERKMAEGDYSIKKRREIPLDPESTKLKFQLDDVKKKWADSLFKDKMARRTKLQKARDRSIETLRTSRAILTSMDVSAVGRQGGILGLAHPIIAGKNIGKMFKAMRSEEQRHSIMEGIKNRENYKIYKEAKMFLSEPDGKLSQMEEQFQSRLAEKIPGVAGSERAYTTYLNLIRADVFDSMAAGLSKTGTPTAEEARGIANYINIATGRGTFGDKFNVGASALNAPFFAPRLVASRFNFFTGQPLARAGSARARKAVAKEYARYLAGLAAMYGIADMMLPESEVETNPLSSDFGKIKVGPVRIDPLSGLAQTITFTARALSGRTKTGKGEIVKLYGDVKPFFGKSVPVVMGRFMRSKLSPILGSAVNILAREDYNGQPTTPQKEVAKMFAPLVMRDIYDAMRETGLPEAAALSMLALFGVGVQIYGPGTKQYEEQQRRNK